MALRPEKLINAKEGLPHKMIGKVKVIEWQSKAVIHKKLQTIQLIHDSDIPHVTPHWDHTYDVVDVVVKLIN